MTIHDDGPSITANATTATLTVDETDLSTNASASFDATTAFSSTIGADGAGTKTYALAVTAGASGLVDTATNEAVNLSLVSGHVEGRTATTNLLVFRVDVDAAGTVTLDQQRAVVHPTTDPDESVTLTADSLVRLTATITDKDGDTASATQNIGQNLVFKDDGPSITANATTATLTVDETDLSTNASASFDATTAFSSSFGADGAGTKTYALAVTAGASGLVDTATNEAVNLSLVSGHVEGRTATTNLLVFRVDVDAAGTVTLYQQRAVVHPTTDPDESVTLT